MFVSPITKRFMSTMPKVLVPIADGSEELEAIAIIDVLRRAAIDVNVASVEAHKTVKMSKGIVVTADSLISDAVKHTYDAIVLPGGLPGADHLRDSAPLTEALKKQRESDKWICAICASPAVVFQSHSLIDDVKATSYPGFQKQLAHPVSTEKVVVDKNVITSQGPGTAIDFGLEIVAQLCGTSKANTVRKGLLY